MSPGAVPMLAIEDLDVFYGRAHALQKVSLTLESGATLKIEKQASLIIHTTFDQWGQSEMELKGALSLPSQTIAGVGRFDEKGLWVMN